MNNPNTTAITKIAETRSPDVLWLERRIGRMDEINQRYSSCLNSEQETQGASASNKPLAGNQ